MLYAFSLIDRLPGVRALRLDRLPLDGSRLWRRRLRPEAIVRSSPPPRASHVPTRGLCVSVPDCPFCALQATERDDPDALSSARTVLRYWPTLSPLERDILARIAARWATDDIPPHEPHADAA